MPIKPENKARYPKNWPSISKAVRAEAGNRCELCCAENHRPRPITGSRVVLTVAHLDDQPDNCERSNLRALCQKCHNRYDAGHRRKNARATRAAKAVARKEPERAPLPLFPDLL